MGAILADFGAAETGAAVPADTRQRQPGPNGISGLRAEFVPALGGLDHMPPSRAASRNWINEELAVAGRPSAAATTRHKPSVGVVSVGIAIFEQ